MEDGLLVSRAIGGDLDSFGELYDRYFNRIYDFCWRILRDADEAADATQDVFMKAMNGLPSLAKAHSFKSWLFTIAHNTAVTRAERGARTTPLPVPTHEEAFGTFDVPDPSRLDNPELAAEDHELASLVWEAAAALSPRDYAVLDLNVRQGLESAEIAQVLNVNKGNAYTMVSRMKQAAGEVIASYIVARRGSKDCETLRQVLIDVHFPPYSDDARRAVDAHLKDCDVCQQSRRTLVAPLQIFGAFAAVPAPFALKGDIWRDISGAWPHGDGALAGAGGGGRSANETFEVAMAAAGGGAGGGGAALAMAHGDDGGSKIVMFAVAVLGLLVLAFAIAGGVILASGAGGDDDDGNGGGGNGDPTAVGSPSTPGVDVETSTPDPAATATEEDAATGTATPTEEGTPTEEATEEPPTAEPATDTPEPVATNTPPPRPTTPPQPSRSPFSGLPTVTPRPQ
jgi:RNA polymerase sigma factor (sigma-70 family)